jgi:anti-anti-sigma factor
VDEELSVALRYEDDAVVLVVSGDLDMGSATLLRDCVEHVELAGRGLVFDIADLGFIDSTGLAALLLANASSASGHTVEVRHASDFHRRMLEIAGLTELLNVT